MHFANLQEQERESKCDEVHLLAKSNKTNRRLVNVTTKMTAICKSDHKSNSNFVVLRIHWVVYFLQILVLGTEAVPLRICRRHHHRVR